MQYSYPLAHPKAVEPSAPTSKAPFSSNELECTRCALYKARLIQTSSPSLRAPLKSAVVKAVTRNGKTLTVGVPASTSIWSFRSNRRQSSPHSKAFTFSTTYVCPSMMMRVPFTWEPAPYAVSDSLSKSWPPGWR